LAEEGLDIHRVGVVSYFMDVAASAAATKLAGPDQESGAVPCPPVRGGAPRSDRQNNGHPEREEIPFRPLLRHGA